MTGLVLHLSGPLQAWGSTAQANVRPTYRVPTRSGMLGMIACCLGRMRGAENSDLRELSFTVRVDRTGQLLEDFHTIGAKHGPLKGLVTATGGHAGKTALSTRYYLSDAAFTVAVEGPEEVISLAENGLLFPHWTPHLGRRSCLPDVPILVGRFADAVAELDRMPVHRIGDAPLLFVYDSETSHEGASSTQYMDDPVAGSVRSWGPRRVWEVTREINARSGGVGTEFLDALTQYLNEERTVGAS
ncbi:type I-E CRISPR-associated protein Cas5/CasD [Streptomyces sp. NPDC000927]|uniref:type I-E CRISPR-associated protein Cas5/CasD n=1 Tax=Streptomyces sp. NPDC000927 TaxID=3154371 RepID=UPI00332FCF46